MTPPAITPLLLTIATVAASSPGPTAPPMPSVGSDRRARVQATRDRTGWAYVKCREHAGKSDAEIDAPLRTKRVGYPLFSRRS